MKLAINAMNNGLTGLTGMTSPSLWMDPRGFAAMVRIGGEVVAVCEALGHRMRPIHPTGAPSPPDPAAPRPASPGDLAGQGAGRPALGAPAGARPRGAPGNISPLPPGAP